MSEHIGVSGRNGISEHNESPERGEVVGRDGTLRRGDGVELDGMTLGNDGTEHSEMKERDEGAERDGRAEHNAGQETVGTGAGKLISRRKLLASLGVAGLAVASAGILNAGSSVAFGEPNSGGETERGNGNGNGHGQGHGNGQGQGQVQGECECIADVDNDHVVSITLSDLRAVASPDPVYYITDAGKQGHFMYDAADTSSVDNTGTIVVSSSGARFKRLYEYGSLDVKWFDAKGDGVTNDNTAFAAAAALNEPMYVPEGEYVLTAAPAGELKGPGVLNMNGSRQTVSVFFELTQSLRLLEGFEPERLSATQLRIFRGIAGDSTGTDIMVKETFTVDLTVTGINGMDTGTVTPGTDYFVYLLKNSATGDVGAVVSEQISTSLVTKPPGYDKIRKLPWGFIYMATGIPGIHLSYWPKPFTRYTDAAMTADWRVLTAGTATTFTSFNLKPLMPDNARMAYLLCVTKHDGVGLPGEAYIRVLGSQGNGIMVGTVANGSGNVMTLHQRVTSAAQLFYKVTGGASLEVYVLGYSNTEPS